MELAAFCFIQGAIKIYIMRRVRLLHKAKNTKAKQLQQHVIIRYRTVREEEKLVARRWKLNFMCFLAQGGIKKKKKPACKSQRHRRSTESPRGAGGEPFGGDAPVNQAWHLQPLCRRHPAQAALTRPRAAQLHPQTPRIKQQESSAPSQKVHPTLRNRLQPCSGSH